MRNSSKLDEANKGKEDQQVSLIITSVKEIRRVADVNQMRLQQLELAVANLTTICSAIRHDMYSLNSCSNQGWLNKVQPEVVEMKRPSYTRSSSLNKVDVLGVQMQQLVKQAAALGILKDSNPTTVSENVKGNSKIQTRQSPKKIIMQATTKQPPGQTTTVVNKNMGAAKAKPSSAGSNLKAMSSAKVVSLKSSVKKTKTTVSKVYVDEQTQKQGKDNVVKTVQQKEGKGSIKLTVVKAYQGQNKSPSPTKTNSSPRDNAVKSDIIKPRRKWSRTTPEDIKLKR